MIVFIFITFEGHSEVFGGTMREPEAISREGQDKEPRLKMTLKPVIAMIVIPRSCWRSKIPISMMGGLWWHACASSHRIPPKHRGCWCCGAYKQPPHLTLFGKGFGSFLLQTFFKGTKSFLANACAGFLLLCWSRDWLLFKTVLISFCYFLLFVFLVIWFSGYLVADN